MTTARDLIKSSMRLATILASGESPTGDELNDGLKVLNDLLENWSTERLTVWSRDNASFATSVGVETYTIGTGATWNTDRPIRIAATCYMRVNGTDFPMSQWGQAEYDQVAVKSTGGIPERFLYVNDYPLGSVTLYPVPSQAMTAVLSIDRVLTFPLTLATVLAYPPGYEKALRFALAANLAPEFGIVLPADVAAIARSCKADIKRANKVRVLSAFDPALQGDPCFAYWQRGY